MKHIDICKRYRKRVEYCENKWVQMVKNITSIASNQISNYATSIQHSAGIISMAATIFFCVVDNPLFNFFAVDLFLFIAICHFVVMSFNLSVATGIIFAWSTNIRLVIRHSGNADLLRLEPVSVFTTLQWRHMSGTVPQMTTIPTVCSTAFSG